MHGQRIGYIRVSSFDQNPERQLEHVDVGKVFTDKASVKYTQRPQFDALLSFAREGGQMTAPQSWRFGLRHIRRRDFVGEDWLESRR